MRPDVYNDIMLLANTSYIKNNQSWYHCYHSYEIYAVNVFQQQMENNGISAGESMFQGEV